MLKEATSPRGLKALYTKLMNGQVSVRNLGNNAQMKKSYVKNRFLASKGAKRNGDAPISKHIAKGDLFRMTRKPSRADTMVNRNETAKKMFGKKTVARLDKARLSGYDK